MRSSCALLALALVAANGFQTAPVRAPLVAARSTATPRTVVKAALPQALNDVSFQLALFGLGEGYGGKSAFSESASGQTGDLGFLFLLGVVFPTLVTIFIYVDGPWKGSD